MKIVINGEVTDTEAGTLQDLLSDLEHAAESVATAVNNEFVPITSRATTKLENGDLVEIIAPMAGG